MKEKKIVKRVGIYVAAIIIAIYIIFPFSWCILSSFKFDVDLAKRSLEIIPEHGYTIWNYKFILGLSDPTEWMGKGSYFGLAQFANSISSKLPNAIINSIVVGVLCVIINVTLACLAGYSFARLKFPAKTPMFLAILFIRMIPGLVVMIPLYLLFKQLQLIDTPIALVLSYLIYTLPLTTWLMSGFISSIPVEIEEAALIDGCSRMSVLFRVTMPLALPGIGAISVLSFMTSWGEFFFAMLFTKTMASKTLPVLLADSAAGTTQYFTYGPINAVTVLAIVPSIILCLLTQKLLVKGLTKGAVKG